MNPMTRNVLRMLTAMLAAYSFAVPALAANVTYTLPADIGTGAFAGCTLSAGATYTCPGNIDFGNDTVTLALSSSLTLQVAGNFVAKNNLTISGGQVLTLVVGGNIQMDNNLAGATINMQAGGNVQIKNNAATTGNIVAGGNITIDNNGTINGNLTAGGSISLGSGTVINGTCSPSHPQCTQVRPTAEYRFDECVAYSNGAGQVVDTQGAYPGTPQSNLQNATPGKINRYADFSSGSRYVNVPSGPVIADWSISVWFQMPFAGSGSHSSQYYVIGSVANGGDLVYIDRNSGSGAYRWGVYTTNTSDSAGSGGTTNGAFRFSSLANGWHHMVVVGQGNSTQLYIDGTLRDTVARKAKGTFQYLGASYDNAGTSSGQSWGAPLDEFKLYRVALSAANVTTLYNNESVGKNWDGTTRPNPCGVTPVAPFAFNCVEAGANALNGHLYTKRAGVGFSFDVVALKDGNGDSIADAVETNYASDQDRTVGVELVNGSGSTACASRTAISPAVSQNLTFAQSAQATEQGRKSIALTVGRAYSDVRCRVTDASQSPAVVGCSTDNFAIRPSSLTVSSGANADATGTSVSATPVVKAGTAFALTATSDVLGYNLAPAIDPAAVSAHAGAVRSVAPSGSFSAADPATGVATGSAFTYDEVGYFRFVVKDENTASERRGVYDAAFTAVDSAPGDCTDDFSNTSVSGKYGCKFGNTAATDYFGRFIPDHFVITPGTLTPGCSGAFTYFAQDGFTTDFTLTAQNAANATTQNYQGSFARLGLTTYANHVFSTADPLPAGSVLASGATAPTGGWSAGQATVSAKHQVSRPTAPAGETAVSVLSKPVDPDGVTTATATAVSASSTPLRYGRLQITNAYGSELLDLPIPVSVQYYTGTAWTLNASDSCTSIVPSSVILSGWTGNLSACETYFSPSSAQTLTSGRATLVLRRPGPSNDGSVALALNIGASASGNTCVSGTSSAATAGNLPQFGATNPSGRATFGVYKTGPVIDRRELY